MNRFGLKNFFKTFIIFLIFSWNIKLRYIKIFFINLSDKKYDSPTTHKFIFVRKQNRKTFSQFEKISFKKGKTFPEIPKIETSHIKGGTRSRNRITPGRRALGCYQDVSPLCVDKFKTKWTILIRLLLYVNNTSTVISERKLSLIQYVKLFMRKPCENMLLRIVCAPLCIVCMQVYFWQCVLV